jgi:uncharacterized HAD superfamily protein
MKIAIDIDGVLLDIIIPYCEKFNQKYNTEYKKKDVTNWDFYKEWNITEDEAFEFFYEIYENTMSVPFIDDDAPKFMSKLHKLHELYILSARASEYRNQIIEKLNFHNIKKDSHYNDIILVYHKPYDLKIHEPFDVYVDDNPNLAKAIHKTDDKYLLLYDQPWNQKIENTNNIIRVFNWKNIYSVLTMSEQFI